VQRFHALVAASLLSSAAPAAPFLVSDPYPPTGVQPDSASLSVSGGPTAVPAIPCPLQSVAGGLQPRCDLGSLSAAGRYTLVLTVVKNAGLGSGGSEAVLSLGGQASSAPFVYTVQGGALNAPSQLRIVP
jgi:non-ribosomal peptide synthetase component E (peptide arylation enzyme)